MLSWLLASISESMFNQISKSLDANGLRRTLKTYFVIESSASEKHFIDSKERDDECNSSLILCLYQQCKWLPLIFVTVHDSIIFVYVPIKNIATSINATKSHKKCY